MSEDDRSRDLRRAAEALLLVTEEPLTAELMAQLLEAPAAQIEDLCRELAAEYDATDRGFQLVRVAGGWRYQTHPDLAPYVERFVLDGQSARLSNAALETLAIVAYKQPVTRAQISEIRGVGADGPVRSLVNRGLVAEVGRDPSPGRPLLYGTTQAFLERLGVDDLSELPDLPDLEPDGPPPPEPPPDGYRAARRDIDVLGPDVAGPGAGGDELDGDDRLSAEEDGS